MDPIFDSRAGFHIQIEMELLIARRADEEQLLELQPVQCAESVVRRSTVSQEVSPGGVRCGKLLVSSALYPAAA